MKLFKSPRFLQDDSNFYFILMVVFIIIFVINKMYFTALGTTIVLAVTIGMSLSRHERKKRELRKYLIDFTNNIDSLSRHALLDFPMPLIIVNGEGNVYWYNSKFKEILGDKHKHLENILDFYSNFPLKSLNQNEESTINIDLNQKNYNILFNKVDQGEKHGTPTYILYWIDNTSFSTLKTMYNNERLIAMLIQIDNYDEIAEKMDKVVRASMVAEIEKKLNMYATRMNGFVIKYETDRFFMTIENRFLENIEAKRFEILEEIKDIKSEEGSYFTLSIGVGAYAKTLTQQYNYAKGALDIALGRGGDQVVVKRINKVKFYGGRSKAVEKRTKVKARIISYALRQIIDQSSNVIIMGHRTGDMDSLGSSIGLYSIVKSRGKKGYIVLNDINPALYNMFERIKKEESEIKDIIINTETAMRLMDEETVCIVLDTHRLSFVEAPDVIDRSDKVVLIDHHRRSAEYIENPILDYIEPYASSTCELVTEIIEYIGDNIKLSKFEAEALLSGIIVDTNSFTYKTGVRTFEAASLLRRRGADTLEVKKLFSENLKTMRKKSEILEKSEIKYKNIAISFIDENIENGMVIAAQCADELLTVKGVKASFVLVKQQDYIHISGRSSGSINVQIILERLGGGGHLTTAGAQIETDDIQFAKTKLYKAIQEYKKESERDESNTSD